MLLALALMPTTTRQGLDSVIETRRLPLYLKALAFVDRDVNYKALARTIGGQGSDEERVLRLFAWTRSTIRDQPAGWPVVDDHVWHIIIRRYGVEEQKADVFTTLATYAGVPAYWIWLEHGQTRLTLSMARVDGRWRVFDVQRGLVFRRPDQTLVSVEDVATDPELIARTAGALTVRGIPYAAFFEGFQAPMAPDILRAEEQMLWPRLTFEAKRLVGVRGRTWDPEPPGSGRRR